MRNESVDVAHVRGCEQAAPAPRGAFGQLLSRRTLFGIGAVTVAAMAGIGTPFATSVFASDGYPTWDDVQRALANENSKAAEITRIEGLIVELRNDVAAKQQIAQQLGIEYSIAQEAYDMAAQRAITLQEQADAEAVRAAEAAERVGKVAAQMYREGGDDTSLELFFSGDAGATDDLLTRLGTMDKLVEANRTVYTEAVAARDNARSLNEQAEVQRRERDRLQREAEQKMVAAQQAADAAQQALDAQALNLATMEAQLDALRNATASTVAGYEAGVEARRIAEEKRLAAEKAAREKAAAEAAARARAEAEAAAKNQNNNSGGGGGGGGGSAPPPPRPAPPSSGGGVAAPSGWVRPAGGWISSWYGPRSSICGNGYCTGGNHWGIDFAAGSWSPIYAAAAGRVVFAAYAGDWGNYIKIDHGNGIVTGYAHIVSGGYNVGYGQNVSAGQVIAYVGSTGASSGPHLHFEVYQNGWRTDPAPFLRDRGVGI